MVVKRGQADDAIERRIITVLAVDMVGSTHHIAGSDPEDAQAFFDACFERLKRAIERAGGRLVSYEGDGGIATFGWPLAFEDHADRACAAAWQIQHGRPVLGPDRQPARFRIGVNSGLAVVRQFRRSDRPRFNTIGETVHLAAKLRQCAPPGGLLVSRDTARLCRSRVDFSPGVLAADAGAPPIECLSLNARPEMLGEGDFVQRYGMPMIGRDEELARLSQALTHRRPLPYAIALIGEPGVGKSRLAAAVVAEAAMAGIGALAVFGDSQKRSTPFAAPRALLADLARANGAGEDVASVLARALDQADEAEAVAALLVTRRGRPRGREVKPTQTQLARALVKAFIALAPARPTVLLVEDLHLVDQESLHFLRLLARARTRRPLTLLVTGRPEARADAQDIAPTVISLEPMPREAMAAIARQLWPRGRPSGSMIGRIVDRADGVPLVLEELVRSIIDGEGPADHAMPRSVGSMIHARLQRLSANGRALAQTLSLLGERVEPDLAAAVMARSADEIAETFLELERFAFIHPLDGPAVRMRHQIIAEACAETIARDQRRELHRRAGEAIRAAAPDLDGRYEQLAFHAEGADDLPGALECLWAAALEARRSAAAGSLNTIFDRAMGVIDRLGASAEARYVDFVLMACASLIQLGEFEKVNRHLPRVMALVRASGRGDLICSTLSQLGMVCWFEGRYEEGLRATEEGLAMARAMNAPALIFSNTIMLTNILHDMGRVARAVDEQRQLCDLLTGDLETARLGATGMPRGTTLAFMGWFLVDLGAHDEGLDFARRALDFAQREQDSYAEVLARNALGRTLTLMGRDAEAANCFAAARVICDRDGYDAIKAHLAGRLATALSRSGRPDEALRIVEDCLRQGLHFRTGQLEVFCLRMGHAEALFATGDRHGGFGELEAAIALARRIDSPVMLAEALGLRARLAVEAAPDDPRIGRDLAEQAEIWRRHGFTSRRMDAPAISTAPAGP